MRGRSFAVESRNFFGHNEHRVFHLFNLDGLLSIIFEAIGKVHLRIQHHCRAQIIFLGPIRPRLVATYPQAASKFHVFLRPIPLTTAPWALLFIHRLIEHGKLLIDGIPAVTAMLLVAASLNEEDAGLQLRLVVWGELL